MCDRYDMPRIQGHTLDVVMSTPGIGINIIMNVKPQVGLTYRSNLRVHHCNERPHSHAYGVVGYPF